VSSDGGLLLLREVDRRLRLTHQVSAVLSDARQTGKVAHEKKGQSLLFDIY